MSEYSVTFRLIGELEPLEQVQRALQDLPIQVRRRGEAAGQGGQGVQPRNVLLLELAHWTRPTNDQRMNPLVNEDEQLVQAAVTLHRMVPILASIDRARCDADLYVSVINELDQAGLELPATLVAAASAAQLKIGVSILVLLDTDEPTPNEE